MAMHGRQSALESDPTAAFVYVPAGHREHDDAAGLDQVPGAHSVHLVTPSPKYPALQKQALASVLPAGESALAMHAKQLASDVAPE